MDKFFKLKAAGTNIRTELIAGATTFFTMAYIIFVNPAILGKTGIPANGVFIATILAAAIGTLIMGLVANVPYAQAPGMGLNAFFTFTVVFALGYSWQQALAMVFICGLINIIITVTQVRKMIIKAIPKTLQFAIGGGIGLFIAYIGIKEAGFIKFTADWYNITGATGDIVIKGGAVVAQDGGSVFTNGNIIPAIVNFTSPSAVLAIIGLAITAILMLRRVKGSILIGIIITTLLSLIPYFGGKLPSADAFSWDSIVNGITAIKDTAFQLDFKGLFADSTKTVLAITTILAFSLSDTFDTIGTFIGTGRKSGIFDDADEQELFNGKGFKSKMDKALFADATATSIGALLGTSNTTTYVESAAGIAAGGKTGLASVVTAILFLLCIFISPIAGMVPSAATAPALIIVGILMVEALGKIEWDNFDEALAAFLTVAIMPFSYSITNGIAAGFIFYVLTKVCRGKIKEIHPIMWIVTVLFLVNFLVMALKGL